MTSLTNKTALVTGASRGIGRATARALAAAGARVIVHYGNAVGEAESLVTEIRGSGGKAAPWVPTSPHLMARTSSPRKCAR